MRFSLSSEFLEKVSGVNVGFLVVENLVCKDAEAVSARLKSVEEGLGDVDIENLPVVKAFDSVFSELGMDTRVSIYNMLNVISKGKSLVMNLPVVDFYNAFVLENNLPAGGYDLDRIVGDVTVRPASGDRFRQLNKKEYSDVDDGILVFADEAEVLCSHWVWKQSDTQKIRPKTKNVLFRFEGLGMSQDEVKSKIEDFVDHLGSNFEFDSASSVVLNEENPEGEIELGEDVSERRARFVDSKELLSRGVSDVIVLEDVIQDLIDGRKLRVKHGVDPTTRDLHLGYAVVYEKLRQFQMRGHTIVFLIGTFTGRFGDPSDKSETRDMRDKAQVVELAQNYVNQLGRILDTEKVEFVYNGDWFDEMSAEDLLRIMSEFTVAGMLERDMFAKRMKEGKGIGLHEIVYPVLQGYDSVEIEADLTVIGTDQTFNELQARPLQSRRGQKPQDIIAMNLLVGTDGVAKMSQSLGNYIGFDDDPNDKFGKVMSIPDETIMTYFEVCTRVSIDELSAISEELKSGVNPRDIKFRLAHEIVTIYDGEDAARSAREHFETVFQKKEVPDEVAEYKISGSSLVIDVMVDSGLASSKSEARRLVEQGGVKVDGEKVDSIEFEFGDSEAMLQVGKRKFLRVKGA